MGENAGIYAVTVPVIAGGSSSLIIGSAVRLCGWSLGDAGIPPVPEELSVAVAAAAAGALTLTGFLSVSEIIVEPAAAWPAGVNQVTVTNLTGGTQTYDLQGGTANPLVVSFPNPVATTGTPVVSVPAIVGGPAYTIGAVGTISGGSPASGNSVANILDAGQIVGVSAPLAGVSDTQMLSDFGIFIGTGVTVKVINGAISGCLYVYDGTEVREAGLKYGKG